MNEDSLSKYLDLFSKLHRHYKTDVGYAPHKPILLLALLDEIERGNISENQIRVTPELVASFRAYWRALVPPHSWRERIVYPFRYLLQDGFWELVKDGTTLTAKELGYPTWLNQLNELIDGARFAPDLWQLLQNKMAINTLRAHLLKSYFDTTQTAVQDKLPSNPLDDEIARLISEAQSRFRPNLSRAKKDDVQFIRHALFPRVIKSLYDDACAVCGLAAKVGRSTIIDAAHIFAVWFVS
jgi:Predicted restriction endonuclease